MPMASPVGTISALRWGKLFGPERMGSGTDSRICMFEIETNWVADLAWPGSGLGLKSLGKN